MQVVHLEDVSANHLSGVCQYDWLPEIVFEWSEISLGIVAMQLPDYLLLGYHLSKGRQENREIDRPQTVQ